MIISIDAEKAFNKFQLPFTIKNFNTAGVEGTFLNIIMIMYGRPIANITFNGEKLKTSFKISNKRRMPTLITFIQSSIESLTHSN